MAELTGKSFRIPVLVPDLPQAAELLPWLERIDAARWYTNFGPLVREFEGCLARQLCDDGAAPSAVCLSSGPAALDLCIAALDLAAGANVLLPAFTFPASIEVGLHHGLTPVLAELDPDNWQLTVAAKLIVS